MLLQGVQEGRKVIRWMGVLVERSHATCCLEGACTGSAATSAPKASKGLALASTEPPIAAQVQASDRYLRLALASITLTHDSLDVRSWEVCRQVVAGKRQDAVPAGPAAGQAGRAHLMELNAQVYVFKGCLPRLAHKAVLSPFPHLQVHRCL